MRHPTKPLAALALPRGPRTPPLPHGFALDLDADTRQLDESCLFGGSPARVLRLSDAGRAAWSELRAGPISSRAAGLLARRLTDAGLAHPRPPESTSTLDVTIVIPVRDRAEMLERCLAAIKERHPVLVVDDASRDPESIAAVCARHRATLLRRDVNGGPGRARDTGLAHVRSEYVAFLDSDCVAPMDWIERLAPHFADPSVGAIAPRIAGAAADTASGRFTQATSCLDLGTRPARVAPGSRVAYVPTAALLVRRAALGERRVFDPALRVGEDVDLVWRLTEDGWRIRYQPDVEVAHTEPATWRGLLRRRYRYGTSAAPLAIRHPDATTPLVLHPMPALTVAAALAGKPVLSVAAFAASVVAMRRRLGAADVPAHGTERALLTAATQTGLGVGRYATQFAAPVLLAAARRSPAALALLLAPPVVAWLRRRPDLDLPRFVLAHIADDVAYGSGVWAGCARNRNFRAVRPTVVRTGNPA